MNRKDFIKKTSIATAAIAAAPVLLNSCSNDVDSETSNSKPISSHPFALPKIPYGYNAFPDVIDAKTMEIHQWGGWKRIYHRGDVMGFILFFVVSIAVIWGILEYFGVGK